MKLVCESKSVFPITVAKVQDFICKVYGVEYNIVENMDLSRGETVWVTLTGNPPGEYDLELLQGFKAGGEEARFLYAILRDLAWRGLMDPGTYAILVG